MATKIIITGKGGVGKTTITALLSYLFSGQGKNVLALDGDPQMNLPYALGLPINEANRIVPLSENADYVEEKTGHRPGSGWGGFLRLNPPVEDVVDRFGIALAEKLSFLVMGTVKKPAAGCLCPENALLEAVIKHVSLRDNEIVLLDTPAGVEHFGRTIAKGFTDCVIVTDATFNAMSVAMHTYNLAKELGIGNIHLLFNRIEDEAVLKKLGDFGKSRADFRTIISLPSDKKLLNYEPSIMDYLQNYPDSILISALSRFFNPEAR